MRVLKWILSITALTLLFAPSAPAQTPAIVRVQSNLENPIYKIASNDTAVGRQLKVFGNSGSDV